MTRLQRFLCALKASVAATVVAWLVMYTPPWIIALMLVSVFVLEPLDSLGFVDLGKSGEAMFLPNYLGWALMVVPLWLLLFWLFLILFWARAEKAAAEAGTPTPSSVAPQTLLKSGPVDAIDGAGCKLSIGDRV